MSESPLAANPFGEQWVGNYFVGREAELSVFRQNLAGLSAKQPNHVLVAGLHGTGKSFYLNKLVEIARADGFAAVLVDLDQGLRPVEQMKSLVGEVIRDTERQINLILQATADHRLSLDWSMGQKSTQFAMPAKDELLTGDLRQDLLSISEHALAAGYKGLVICVDEGQRIEHISLSVLKNALNRIGTCLLILSYRLTTDAKGAVQQARDELERKAATGEGDIGSAWFFSSGTAIGPFGDDTEVLSYFDKRLENNALDFPPNICLRIGDIASRVPRTMTGIASSLYNKTLAASTKSASMDLLEDCFRERYQTQLQGASDLTADLSQLMKEVVAAVADFRTPAAPLDLIKRAFPNYDQDSAELMALGLTEHLVRLSSSTALVRCVDNKFVATDNICRYAIKIALQTW